VSTADVRRTIRIVELALKDAGPDQALKAVIDVLKEIARALEVIDNRSGRGRDDE
jgi:hypothetical protein